MPTEFKARPRPSRVRAALDRALPIAQTVMMFSAAAIFVLLLAEINASSTMAAVDAGQLPFIATYMP